MVKVAEHEQDRSNPTYFPASRVGDLLKPTMAVELSSGGVGKIADFPCSSARVGKTGTLRDFGYSESYFWQLP